MEKNKLEIFLEIAGQLHHLGASHGMTKEQIVLLLKIGNRETTIRDLIEEIVGRKNKAVFNEKYKIKFAKDTKALTDLGLLNKTILASDKRVHLLSPTDKGKAVIDEWNKNSK